ncbi:MAG: FecR domain-containing protein [Elusimicrobia bacterium]|nr:FecR domain-containing protein [Elusimicrobiota bacterium]
MAPLFSVLTSMILLQPAAAATVSQADGVAQIRRAGARDWSALQAPERLAAGDALRTGLGASARVDLGDGAELRLGPRSELVLEAEEVSAVSARLEAGRLRASRWLASRSLSLRTPTAACRLRGGDSEFEVGAGGETRVEAVAGRLAVEDLRGSQTFLRPGERIVVDLRGLGPPEPRQDERALGAERLRAEARAEVALDSAQDRLQAGSAREARLGELHQGRSLIDVTGARVRVEEYVLRPRSDQLKLVALSRRGDGLGYLYYFGTFNQALPADLSLALAQLPGCVERACDWYLTEFVLGRSNGTDSVLERGLNTLGGQVDVNRNGDPDDDVALLFDSRANAYADVAASGVYRTLFNRYGFYVDGRLKHGWSGDGITTYADVSAATAADPFTGAALTPAGAWLDPQTGELAVRTVNVTFPSSERLHQQVYESFSDGSFVQWDHYVLDGEGRVSPKPGASSAGLAALGGGLLDHGYEQVLTSSHFAGRKIDLVLEPKLLLQAGLLR